MACLDTTVFIDLFGRHSASQRKRAITVLESLGDDETRCTTRFNVAELLVGVAQSHRPDEERERIRGALREIIILEFDQESAEWYAQFAVELRRLGRPVGTFDLLIASVARANGEALVTRNPRHFIDIPDLNVVNY